MFQINDRIFSSNSKYISVHNIEMSGTTLRNLIGGKRQKKQRQSKKGGKTQKRRQQQKQQQGGVDPLQKVVDMMKGGEGEQKMAAEALQKSIGGNADVMAKLQQLLPSP